MGRKETKRQGVGWVSTGPTEKELGGKEGEISWREKRDGGGGPRMPRREWGKRAKGWIKKGKGEKEKG